MISTYLSTLSLASSSAQNLHNSGKSGVRLVHGVWIGKSLSEIIQIIIFNISNCHLRDEVLATLMSSHLT